MAAIPEAVLAALLGQGEEQAPTQPAAKSLVPTTQQPEQSPLDLTTVIYSVHAILKDIGDAIVPCSGLAWEEQASEIGARITMQFPADTLHGGPGDNLYLPNLMPLGTQITVRAAIGTQDWVEVCRGTIEELAPNDGEGGTFEVVAYSPLKNLLNSKVNNIYSVEDYPTPKHILERLLGSDLSEPNPGWNVDHDIDARLGDVTPYDSLNIYKGKTLADIILDCMAYANRDKSTKEAGRRFVLKSVEGKLIIGDVGGNNPIYWLNQLPNAQVPINLSSVKERFSITDLITKLIVTGTDAAPDQPGVIGVVEEVKDTYGLTRQDIYAVPAEKSYMDMTHVEDLAHAYMNDNGGMKVTRSLDAPDIPFIHKYDFIRISAGTMDDKFVVEGITHTEDSRKMTLTLSNIKSTPDIGTFTPAPNGDSYIPQPSTGGDTGSGGSYSGGALTPEQLYSLAIAAGFKGEDAIIAVAISLAEDPGSDPTTKSKPNSDGSSDLGLWQINSGWWPKFGGEAALKVPLNNAKAAYAIYHQRGDTFKDWVTFNRQLHLSHMGVARAAAAAPRVPVPTDDPSAKTSAGSNTSLNTAIKGWLNVPYRDGGSTKAGTDCSGFTQSVFKEVGVSLPRTAQAQFDSMKIHPKQPQYGDLVFFHGTYNTPDYISHVAIVTGPGQMVGAAIGSVKMESYNSGSWASHFVGYGRPS